MTDTPMTDATRGGRRTSAPARTHSGVTFTCWQTGILAYEWRSMDGRIRVWSNPTLSTYSASLDGQSVGARFYTLNNAMKAAAKALHRKGRAQT